MTMDRPKNMNEYPLYGKLGVDCEVRRKGAE